MQNAMGAPAEGTQAQRMTAMQPREGDQPTTVGTVGKGTTTFVLIICLKSFEGRGSCKL